MPLSASSHHALAAAHECHDELVPARRVGAGSRAASCARERGACAVFTETEGYMYEDRNPIVDCADGEKPADGKYVNRRGTVPSRFGVSRASEALKATSSAPATIAVT